MICDSRNGPVLRRNEDQDIQIGIMASLLADPTASGEDIHTFADLNHKSPVTDGAPNPSDLPAMSDPMTSSCLLYRFVFSVGVTGTICFWGMLGNVLSLIVLWRWDHQNEASAKSSTGFLLSALAVMDILVLGSLFVMKTIPSFCGYTGVLPQFFLAYPYLLVYGWPFNDLVHAFSTWLTVLVTFQRFVAVCQPHRAAAFCSRRRAQLQVTATLFLCALFELPVFLDFYPTTVLDPATNTTVLSREYTALSQNYWYQVLYKTTLYYTLIYIIPLLLMAVLTTLLIRALNKAKMAREAMTNAGSAAAKEDITLVLIVVVIICMLCQPWEPVRRILEATLGGQPGCGHFYFYYEELPSLSFAVNSAANFVVYCLVGSRFRNTLGEMFCGRSGGIKSRGLDTSVSGSTTTLSTTTSRVNDDTMPEGHCSTTAANPV